VLLIAAVMFTFATIVAADHSWGDRHWARQQNPLLLDLGENLPDIWNPHLIKASADWNNPPIGVSTFVVTEVVPGNGSSRCLPTKGRVEICDGAGHKTLGVAQVWVNKTNHHIEQAVVKLSDYHLFLPGSKYNSIGWRNYVVCQEIGHTFGLDHQDEDINNPNLGSCMDYTEDPDGQRFGQLANEQPNLHDFEQLRTIYTHTDTFDSSSTQAPSGGSASARSNAKLENSSEWGKGIQQDARGRTNVFELDLGRAEKIVTFVLWAD
jgi:hypothetical protein